MNYHDFYKKLNFSESIGLPDNILQKLLTDIPMAYRFKKATLQEDKSGIDYYIERLGGLSPIGVDFKNRSFCPIIRHGSDDVCIEGTSVYTGLNDGNWKDSKREKCGWTVDKRKKTDYIVYTWPCLSVRRFWVVPFPFLCRASIINYRKWASEYGEKSALNKHYSTLSVFVPREIVKIEMEKLMYSVA